MKCLIWLVWLFVSAKVSGQTITIENEVTRADSIVLSWVWKHQIDQKIKNALVRTEIEDAALEFKPVLFYQIDKYGIIDSNICLSVSLIEDAPVYKFVVFADSNYYGAVYPDYTKEDTLRLTFCFYDLKESQFIPCRLTHESRIFYPSYKGFYFKEYFFDEIMKINGVLEYDFLLKNGNEVRVIPSRNLFDVFNLDRKNPGHFLDSLISNNQIMGQYQVGKVND